MTDSEIGPVMTDTEITTVFEGGRPQRAGDLRDLEVWGIAPIPENGRYGGAGRVFFPWFTGNMELSAVFLGTVAVAFGLGFGLGALALGIGIVLGAIPVAILCTWGPRTGTGQLPLARVPFGRSVVVPGAVQWLSAIGWVAVGCYFGSQAAGLLFHIPFLVAAAIVLALVGIISAWGYEGVMQAETWGAVLMAILFAYLTIRIFQHHVVLPHNTAHGGALVGGFVVMVAVALSGSFSWASYGSDYFRYLKPGSSRTSVFWYTMAGMSISYAWLAFLGLAAASVLSNQTAAGVNDLVGGGVLGDLVLAAIVIAAVFSSSMNAYSGSLAMQSLNIRIRRPAIAVISVLVGFGLISWMHSGNLDTKFTNILLFTGYWLSPFVAIVMIDWHYNNSRYTPASLRTAMAWHNLSSGWAPLIAFGIGFGTMVPFMNTSLWEGPVAKALNGADLAYYIGFFVTGLIYYFLRRMAPVAQPLPEDLLAGLPTAGEPVVTAGQARPIT